MNIAVDISLYPLHSEYLPPIKAFIARLEQHRELAIAKNDLSTQVQGEFEAVFAALKAEIARTFGARERAVFVLKMVGGG
jgi:uncharacterized protein YqgV (UPF0045/DUF77 family)